MRGAMYRTVLENITIVIGVLALITTPTKGQNSAAKGERDTGLKHLLITYHCPATSRFAFHDYMINQGVPAFQDWKRTGVVGDYYIVVSSYDDSVIWAMLSILSCNHFAAVV